MTPLLAPVAVTTEAEARAHHCCWWLPCNTRGVVKTGARALVLQDLLTQIDLGPVLGGPPVPRLTTLPPEMAGRILDLFEVLGGTSASPALRPGAWDLVCKGGVLVELDEELHFNRYRRLTLEPDWMKPLPWCQEYLTLARDRESECLAAATWGKRWTNPSCEVLFGAADPPGRFDSNGAPRWKQRALYDAIKDAAALTDESIHLVRLATHDLVGGIRLGDALEGRATVKPDALSQLVTKRST